MVRRGFSLLEVAIALSLLVALAALVGGAMLPLRDEQVREQTLRQVCESIRMASYDARRAGEARLLIARADEDGRWALAVRALSGPASSPVATAGGGRRGGAARAGAAGDERVLMALPAGWRVSRHLDEAVAAAAGGGAGGEGVDLLAAMPQQSFFIPDEARGGGEGPLTLAVLLPDGSAVAGGAVYVLAAQGRAVRLEVSSWSGEPRVSPVEAGQREGVEEDPLAPPARRGGEAGGEAEPGAGR